MIKSGYVSQISVNHMIKCRISLVKFVKAVMVFDTDPKQYFTYCKVHTSVYIGLRPYLYFINQKTRMIIPEKVMF